MTHPAMKAFCLLLLVPCLLGSCRIFRPVKDDADRHLLDPAIGERQLTRSSPALGIARPTLPKYLDRQQLVARTGDGRLLVEDNQLWAEPLDAAISRVVADNLRRLTGSTNIQPTENFVTPDYAALVEIRIEEFGLVGGNRMVLKCTWKSQPINGAPVNPKPFSVEVPLSGGDSMHARVNAMNEALAGLSRRIASNF